MSLPYVLVLVADRASGVLPPALIDIARGMVQGDAAVTLSPGEAVEIPCPAPGPGQPTIETIRAVCARERIDALLVKARGRRKAVLVADMDSTILVNETLDDLADLLGLGPEIRAITEASMNGELDFAAALHARVALLEGKPASRLEEVLNGLAVHDGAETLVHTMKAHNARTALVSGGFTFFTRRVAERIGFDEHHGNELAVRNGILTGQLAAPVLGPETKLVQLERIAAERGVKRAATLATGDGANDLPMLRAAGLGIAYHAKPRVRAEIAMQVNFATLRAHLFAQGYPASAFVA
ncbi:phosphoserine phosphatase SerB [Acidomonas methanolica]|uniref:Phosphoserine phosphatase n=1 Tax=Acidomonas methanolica NBRC 104435 TaxID=1231351 RepID=A0A023D8H9_ACIMT|nr:phosphoserine phosphatase SerB [Acidomonas methanolica]MBU2652923.1 phosphoserine phosphatase SerB [Acidomonas methanolica]TCS31326.1 phosphoserine phosphatase [Acidomonas methanolica]GAJ30448.1 phosphoserine phosphatase [Acidomonas methanolica NBRC 104435]GBQ50848.1 phosphoserine phosphatase [Acidomonas methanolica]GEK98425.1 phosphoserine phosphatase SerB [Acidomonas methanolica NBRC 104435]